MSDSAQNRVFHYAILASLALHALLFLGFPDLINSARRAVESFPPPILARLMAPEPAVAPAAPTEAPRPVPVQKPAPPKPAKPVVKPAPDPEPAPAANAQPAPPSPVAPAEAPPAPAAAEPAPGPVASVPAAPPGAQPGAPPRDARTIGEYRLELIEAAKRIKDRTRYPPIARDNNWTGQTQVRVALAATGTPAISVKGTSGHQLLDQHALGIFRQATREVSLPAELRGREFAVDVWMDFTLTQ